MFEGIFESSISCVYPIVKFLRIVISDELMKEINSDIAIGDDKLNEPKYQSYQNHDFFSKAKIISNCPKNSSHADPVNGNVVKI